MDLSSFDIGSLNDLVNTSGDAVKTVNGGLDAVKKIRAFFGSGKEVSPDEIKALVLELQEQLYDAKLANIELKKQLIELRDAALQKTQHETRFDRYELRPTEAGQIALHLKQEFHQEEVPHIICQPCKEKGFFSVMNGNEALVACSECRAEVRLKKQLKRKPKRGPIRSSIFE